MATAFLFACAGLLLGSLLVSWSRADLGPAALLLLAGVVALAGGGARRLAGHFLIALIGAAIGFLYTSHHVARWDALPSAVAVESEWVVVKSEPPKVWYQPIILEPGAGADPISVRVLWRAPRTLELSPGERISLRCALTRPENFDPRFDYARYLSTRGVGYMCQRADHFEPLSDSVRWRVILSQAQHTIRHQISELLPEPAAGLLQGLFLGGDDALAKPVSEAFRRAGLSHIVAVSGYNMTLVAFAVLFLALSIGLWRKTATVLAVLGILAFLLLIDTSAASIRAALMAWIVFLVYFLGRPASAAHGLSLAATLMLLENPLIVRYDVGFQLSFAATLALVVASPWIERLVRGHWGGKLLALPLTTLAIEAAIYPIVAFHFGMVSLVGPVANTLVLPLIPIAMGLGFLSLVTAFLWPGAALLFALPTWLMLTMIVWVAEAVGGLEWAVRDGLAPTPSLVVAWYIVLALLVWYSRKSYYAYVLRMDQSRSHR